MIFRYAVLFHFPFGDLHSQLQTQNRELMYVSFVLILIVFVRLVSSGSEQEDKRYLHLHIKIGNNYFILMVGAVQVRCRFI